MVSTILNKLKGPFVRNLATLASGTVVGQIVFILATPVITRLYSPEEIGMINLYVSVATVFFFVACLRLELAIVLAKDDEEAVGVFALACIATAATTLVSTALVLLFGRWFAELLGAPGLAAWLIWMPLNVLIYGLYLALRLWSTRKEAFRDNSISQLSMYSTTAGLRVGAGFLGLGVFGLMASYIAGRVVAVLYLLVSLGRKFGSLVPSKLRFSQLKELLKTHKNFPLFETPQMMTTMISWLVPTYLLTFFFSLEVVGHYTMALQLILLPVTFTAEAIRQIFLQRADALQKDGEDIGAYLKKVTYTLAAVGFLPCVAIAVLGPWVFGVVLGEEWYTSGLYSRILAPWIFVFFCNTPANMMVQILGKQKIHFALSIVLLVFRVATICVGGYMNDVILAIALYSALGVVFYLFHTILIMHYAKAASAALPSEPGRA